MNSLKTLLATTTVIAAFSLNSAYANGFFTVGTEKMSQPQPQPQPQPSTFNSQVHKGTTFWDYYYSGHSNTVNKNKQVASFDESKLSNPYLAPLYN